MEIENIFYLLGLLLLIPVVIFILLALKWKKNIITKLGEHRLVQQLIADYSPKKFLVKAVLPLAALALLVFALTNLRKPSNSEKIKLSGTDLMIALDVSNSMMAKDIQPNRLEKSKLLISKLIDQLNGNRMGLVVFAGNAYLQMPLTSDASSAKLFLSTISPDLVPLQGTNISDALLLCNRSLNNQEQKYKSILLISDGEDHDDEALKTAKDLRKNGVIINTIGVGSPSGAPIQDRATGEMKRDDQGNVILSKINEKELQDIASQTNGSYQLLNEADAAAKNIIDQLEGMDKKPITDTTLTNYTSYYWIFILAAMILLVIDLFISEKKRAQKKFIDFSLASNKEKNNNTSESTTSKLAKVATMLLLVFGSSVAFAQKENETVRKGNDAYKQQKFDEAAKQYEAALQQNKDNTTANFNLGNTQFKSGNYDVASKKYEALSSSKDKDLRAKSFYNQGVSLAKQKKFEEAVNAFKQSLRSNPNDDDTRENLQKAMNELRQQQQQDKKDDKDKKDKKDDKKKEDQKDKDKSNEEKKKQEKEQQQKEKQEQQEQKPKITKEDANQKLEALQQEEKKLQQKLNQRQKSNVKQPEKDW